MSKFVNIGLVILSLLVIFTLCRAGYYQLQNTDNYSLEERIDYMNDFYEAKIDFAIVGSLAIMSFVGMNAIDIKNLEKKFINNGCDNKEE